MMTTCPNCGQSIRDEYKLCPFCGTDVETGAKMPLSGRRDDGFALNGGLTVGGALLVLIYYLCGAMYLESGNMLFAARHGTLHVDQGYWLRMRIEGLWLGFLLPIVLTGLPYLLLRRQFPAFARGLGYSCLVALAVTLGAPLLCSR